MNVMKYKQYTGSAEVSVEDGLVFGKLLNIRDLVTYESDCISKLQEEFESAVEDYLADCLEEGREPDEPFKGAFNVRMKPSQHRDLATAARQRGTTLNDYVVKALSYHQMVMAPNNSSDLTQWTVQQLLATSQSAMKGSKSEAPMAANDGWLVSVAPRQVLQ